MLLMRPLEESPFELVFSVRAGISDADMNVETNPIIAALRSMTNFPRHLYDQTMRATENPYSPLYH